MLDARAEESDFSRDKTVGKDVSSPFNGAFHAAELPPGGECTLAFGHLNYRQLVSMRL